MKKLPEVDTEEHKERMKADRKYAKIYRIAKATGASKKDSKKIAASFDIMETLKSKVKDEKD